MRCRNPYCKSPTSSPKEIRKAPKKGAAKVAAGLEEVLDLMDLYRPVAKGGMGLEQKLKILAKKAAFKDAEEVDVNRGNSRSHSRHSAKEE